jgi:hypothetical protein
MREIKWNDLVKYGGKNFRVTQFDGDGMAKLVSIDTYIEDELLGYIKKIQWVSRKELELTTK